MSFYHFPFPCCVCSPRDGSLVYRLPVIHQLLPVLFIAAALVAACLCLLFTLSILAVYFNSPIPVLYLLLRFYVVYSFLLGSCFGNQLSLDNICLLLPCRMSPPPPQVCFVCLYPGLHLYAFFIVTASISFFSYLIFHHLFHGSLKGCLMP